MTPALVPGPGRLIKPSTSLHQAHSAFPPVFSPSSLTCTLPTSTMHLSYFIGRRLFRAYQLEVSQNMLF